MEITMQRRAFLTRLMQLAGLAASPAALAAPKPREPLLLQVSPVAGFQYHQGESCWAALAPGDGLQLTREPDNAYDDRAIRVDWNGRKLGYIPRVENTTLSSLLDRGHPLDARIEAKRESANPWRRLSVAVYLAEPPGRT
jgi:hypothetical protein